MKFEFKIAAVPDDARTYNDSDKLADLTTFDAIKGVDAWQMTQDDVRAVHTSGLERAEITLVFDVVTKTCAVKLPRRIKDWSFHWVTFNAAVGKKPVNLTLVDIHQARHQGIYCQGFHAK